MEKYSENKFDELSDEIGTELDDKSIKIVPKEKIERECINNYMYDEGCAIPGEDVGYLMDRHMHRDEDVETVKEQALDTIVQMSAMAKIKEERERIENQNKVKLADMDNYISNLMYQYEEEYFVKYKHMMSGQEKRRLRKMLERKCLKGRLKPVTSSLN